MAHHLSRAGSVVLQQAGGLRRGSVELRGGGGAPGVRSPVCQHVHTGKKVKPPDAPGS
jgi:hypothetical protein